MDRIEELVQVIKDYTKAACEDPKDYENICGFCDDILENSKAEKERIVKELQSEELGNLIKKNRRDGFGEREVYQGTPEYHYREGFSDGIGVAIKIVDRGDKE